MTESGLRVHAVDWSTENAPGHDKTMWVPQDYAVLVEMIKHCDNQINSANRYHLAAVAALIPALALLLKVNVPLYTVVAMILLGVALCIRWLTLTSKLNLEKLCWVSLARIVEKNRVLDPVGPFTAQQEFFSVLPERISNRDEFVMRRVGTRKLYLISVVILGLALFAAALAALTGRLPY